MVRCLIIFFFLIGNYQNLFAQKALYLKPFFGIQSPFCHYDRKIVKNEAFKVKNFQTTDNFGLLLELVLNEDWTISTGWSKGNIGWGFKETIPQDISKGYGFEIGGYRGNYIHRFPVMTKKRLAEVAWLEIDPEKELYVFNFKFYAQSGLSLDYIPYANALAGTDTTGWGVSTGDYILNYERVKVLNRWNTSVQIGLGAQFYHNGRPRFDITLFYSQGLRNMVQIDIDTDMNGLKFNTRLLTRGSVVGATLAYPIRLKTFERKPN